MDQFTELVRSGCGWISPKGLCVAADFQMHLTCFKDHPQYGDSYKKLCAESNNDLRFAAQRTEFLTRLYDDGWVRVGANDFTNEVGLEGHQKHVVKRRRVGKDIAVAMGDKWELTEWYVNSSQ